MEREREATDGFLPAVEVWRGRWRESLHRAAAVVVDGGGSAVFTFGDVQRPVPWRSTAKPFQAWPLVESGAQERFRISTEGLAISCASHGGESFHLEAVRGLLATGGLAPSDLLCGTHPPMHETSARRLVREGVEPTPLHNNCSGKHAGMLLTARHLGGEISEYLDEESPVQQAIVGSIARHAGVEQDQVGLAVDGCSAPTFILPLIALARAYAGLAAALEDPALDRSGAVIAQAMVEHPALIAGTDRLDTHLMQACPARLVAKVGAEGLYAIGAIGPRGPLGLALKIADGDADRARHALVLALVGRLGLLDARSTAKLAAIFPLSVTNHRGWTVGEVRLRPEVLDGTPAWK